MAKIEVYNLRKEKVDEIELKDDIFNVPVKSHILHRVVVAQLANRRAGTASTKGRSEIKLSKRKLWRQKGTGRARVGAASSPIRRGGGVAFGPKPRKYIIRVPKKIKRLALKMALSDKYGESKLLVLQELKLPRIKTKDFLELLKTFSIEKALFVTNGKERNFELSSRNVPGIKVMRYEGLNVYDVLRYEYLVMERAAIEKVQEVLSP